MSKLGKSRGADYEREICATLSDHLGTKVKRILSQARDGGADIEVPPFLIECKRRRKIAVYEWLEQAQAATEGTDRIPVVVCRADRKESIVILRLTDALHLMQNDM